MADINPNALLEFARTITTGAQSKSGARLATVTRVDENGVAYVQLPGGEESPIGTTGATYNIGDVVSVSMYGGKLRTVDNISAPSVSERVVRAVVKPVSKAADLAKKAANEADKVATAINQHFWADDNGVHVTEADHDATTEHNILINSLGILLRKASNYLVSITQSAIAFYDGQGNNAGNILAQFGSNGAQIGKLSSAHSVIDANGQRFYGADGTTQLANIGYGEGNAESGTANAPYYTLGTRWANAAIPYSASTTYTVGSLCYYNSELYICNTNISTAEAWTSSHWTKISEIIGNYSVSEGSSNRAIGIGSHAEGAVCNAVAAYSHAEGRGTFAGGIGPAHAEGADSVAKGMYSHAQNNGTIASRHGQTAIGTYNLEDGIATVHPNGNLNYGKYAFIVGNGTADNARSNALAVKWDGTVVRAGDVAWTNLPLSSGWQAYSANWTPRYRKVGQTVEVRGAVSPTAATLLDANDVTFANLPQGCRPTVSVVHVCQSSGVKIWTLSITDAGEVRAGRLRTMNSTNYQSAGTSEWLAFDVTFLI